MPTSEARVIANRMNAAKSTGPKTDDGKDLSRRNALKHGLTGAGVVLTEADAIELRRRGPAFVRELNAVGDLEVAMARRAAVHSVRMERGADQQAAALTEHVRQVEIDFVVPERTDAEEEQQLRSEAARRAMFDPSRSAQLARQYEAAAERGFYRALKELRQHQSRVNTRVLSEVQTNRATDAEAMPATSDEFEAMLGSFLTMRNQAADLDELMTERGCPPIPKSPNFSNFSMMGAGVELPFAVGRVS